MSVLKLHLQEYVSGKIHENYCVEVIRSVVL